MPTAWRSSLTLVDAAADGSWDSTRWMGTTLGIVATLVVVGTAVVVAARYAANKRRRK